MCAIEDCVSFPDAQPSICRHVNWALFSCHSKINPPFRNLKSLPGIVAQFIELVNNNKRQRSSFGI